jgi:hypothetical protein
VWTVSPLAGCREAGGGQQRDPAVTTVPTPGGLSTLSVPWIVGVSSLAGVGSAALLSSRDVEFTPFEWMLRKATRIPVREPARALPARSR